MTSGQFRTLAMFYLLELFLAFCSFLSPCLALFFNQTTTSRNLNYFYKRNILFTNLLFGCIFAGLVLQINTHQQKGNSSKKSISCKISLLKHAVSKLVLEIRSQRKNPTKDTGCFFHWASPKKLKRMKDLV